MEEIKLCKNCKYFNKFFYVCIHPSIAEISFIDGEPLPEEKNHCQFVRKDEARCGKEAKLFEPISDIPLQDDRNDLV